MSTATATETVTKIKPPSMWKVVMFNDDSTPAEFVVGVLVNIYNKTTEDANVIMRTIHNEGRGVVAVYPLELARQRVADTMRLAESYKFPLKVIKEEA